MTALADRMKEIESATGLTVGEIAKLCSVSSSAVSQWFGRGDKPSKEIGSIRAAVRLERLTGLSALWIAYGEGPRLHTQTTGSAVPGAPVAAIGAVEALIILGDAIENAASGRSDALNLLHVYIGNPSANGGLPPLIAQRLAGEITEPAQRRANGI